MFKHNGNMNKAENIERNQTEIQELKSKITEIKNSRHCPDQYGSLGWVSSRKVKGCQFDS